MQQVADAAIAVLADQGARGLTHRAVDQAGELPPGTTSNYARTRSALLTLTLARIAELDAAEGGEVPPGPGEPVVTVAGLAADLTGMLQEMITSGQARQRLRARYELALEATRRPELRAAYDDLGRGFRTRAAALLAAAGAADPETSAWTLVAWLEGVLFYALAGAGRTSLPPAAALRAQLARLLASMCGDDPAGA